MQLRPNTWLLCLACLSSLFACSDHRLGGNLSPIRLRLSQTTVGNFVTTYTYDEQNRLSRITSSTGGINVITYGDGQNKYGARSADDNNAFFVSYAAANPTQGFITRYPTSFDGTSFLAIKYNLINFKIDYFVRQRDYQYTFDANRQLIEYDDYNENGGPDFNSFKYSYTNGDITKEAFSYTGGHGDTGTNTYTYDDKLNPFFGLLDPSIDINQRFSHHNVLSLTSPPYAGPSFVSSTYEYEYNSQGLPTKRTKKVGGAVVEVLSYGYESY